MDLSTLNDAQRKAVMSDADKILCLAGAGTGKTRVLTCRVARVFGNGVSPKNMACLTFTRAAGVEMKERVIQLIGNEGKKLFCNTFHSFCVRLIRHRGNLLGFDEKFSIYDGDDELAILDTIIHLFKYRVTVQQVLDFRGGRSSKISPVELKQCQEVMKEYDFRMRQNNAIDFDGLISTAIQLLQRFPSVRQEYHRRYSYLFVDEFQDTDHRQLELIKLIDPDHLFVVGDDFQSIYQFRGSDIKIILGMATDPNFQVIKLEENYRSTKPIIDAANLLIKHNTQTEKKLITDKPGEPVSAFVSADTTEEINDTASRISALVQSAQTQYRDIAVLARTNRQLDEAKQVFDNLGIPCTQMSAAHDPMKSADIKQIFCWIDAVMNPANDAVIRKVIDFPTPTIGKVALLETENYQYKSGISFLEAIRENAKAPEFLHRYDTVSAAVLKATVGGRPVYEDGSAAFVETAKWIGAAKRYADEYRQNRILDLSRAADTINLWKARQIELGEPYDVDAMLQWFRLRDIQEKAAEEDKNEVRLMTVHGSKGLEFNTVFIIGMNQGVFPGRGDIEEERRLFYVAMTRAKERLYISRPAVQADWNGDEQPAEPSQFLREFNPEGEEKDGAQTNDRPAFLAQFERQQA